MTQPEKYWQYGHQQTVHQHILVCDLQHASTTPTWAVPAGATQRVTDATSSATGGATQLELHSWANGDPSVAFDKNNNAVCVWASRGMFPGNSSRIWSNFYNGSTFGTCTSIQFVAAGNAFAFKPKIAFLKNSTTGYAVWVEYSATAGITSNVAVVKKVTTTSSTATFATTDNNVIRLDSGATSSDQCNNPQLYLSDTRGICVFEKYETATGYNHVYAARLTDTSTWTAATTGGAGTGINAGFNLGPISSLGYANPQGCLMTSDVPIVTFGRNNSTTNAQATALAPADGYTYASKGTWSGTTITWDTPIVINGDFSTSSWNAVMASNGNFVMCIFQQNNSSSSMRRYYYATYNGTSWTKPAGDSTAYAMDLGYGKGDWGTIGNITMDTASKAYAVFVESDGTSPQCYANLYY